MNGSNNNQTQNYPPYGDLQYKFNASMAIIVVVLVTTFFFMALFVLYIRRCNLASVANLDWATGRMNDQQNAQNHQNNQNNRTSQNRGLDPDSLAKLPILRYASIKSTAKRGKAGADCSVCLLQFEENDTLRLLPVCGHVFHAECIDMWLETHSTCPLCRRSLDATVAAENAAVAADAPNGHLQRALSAVVNSFRRESLPPDRSSDPTTPQDDLEQQDLVASALSKNSESFRIAAHDLELMEVREKIRARSRRFQSSRSLRFVPLSPPPDQESVAAPPEEPPPALRRSFSDGEALVHNWGGAAATSSSSSNNGSLLFPAFARKSLKKWLARSSSTNASGIKEAQATEDSKV